MEQPGSDITPRADLATDLPGAEPVPVAEQPTGIAKKPRGNFDTFVAKVRDNSPAWLVNNGTRISLCFKALADGLSVWSALRKDAKSPWRLTGSSITLASELMGSVVPEKVIPEERQQSYASMSRPQYFWTKTKEAFHPKDNISETAGFALILNGFCLAMAGVAQSSKNQKSWEILQGLMTSVAGMFMTYMPDRERAWQIAHTTFIVRSVPAALQAHNAYHHGFPDKHIPPGDWQQWAKWVSNQTANGFGTLYGGVKKLPDGSIEHIGKKGEGVTARRQSRRLVSAHDPLQEQTPPKPQQPLLPKTVISHAQPGPTIEAQSNEPHV